MISWHNSSIPSEELLEVSALLAASAPALDVRKFSPQGLGAAALALRNAADMMLDEDWESAMADHVMKDITSIHIYIYIYLFIYTYIYIYTHIQCEAPKIAKLLHNYNNYGLWMLMAGEYGVK